MCKSLELTQAEREWLIKHAPKLPDMNTGRRIGNKPLEYVGLIESDINPRQGSEIYLPIGLQFAIARINKKTSRIPGAPRQPMWQWIRRETKI